MKEILLLFPVSPKYLFAPFPQLQAWTFESRIDRGSRSITITPEQTVAN